MSSYHDCPFCDLGTMYMLSDGSYKCSYCESVEVLESDPEPVSDDDEIYVEEEYFDDGYFDYDDDACIYYDADGSLGDDYYYYGDQYLD